MVRHTPRSTRTVTLFPYTTLFRSQCVDAAHLAGLGVIIDWRPVHFPNDPHGLAWFDGTHLYEHADPREGLHPDRDRSEEHTSELQTLMRISYAVFCL